MNILQIGWKNFLSLWTSKKYFCLKGRATRQDYWSVVLISILIQLPLYLVDYILITIYLIPFSVLTTLYGLAIFLPMLSLEVRRLHDVGKSGKLLLGLYILMGIVGILTGIFNLIITYDVYIPSDVMVIALLVLLIAAALSMLALAIAILVFYCKPSQQGENRYGEPCGAAPKEEQSSVPQEEAESVISSSSQEKQNESDLDEEE